VTPFVVSPRLATIWNFQNHQFARLAFGMAFRKPTFFNSLVHLKEIKPLDAFPELVDFFKEAIGNEKISNESITSLEAGYYGRFLDNRLVLEGDAFYQRYRDTITFHLEIEYNQFGLPNLKESVAEYRNTGREVDSLGGSLSATWRIKRVFRLNLNYTYRYSYFASDPAGIVTVGEGGEGDRVAWEPAHLFNLGFHYLPETGLRLGVVLNVASAFDGAISKGSAFDARFLVHQSAQAVLGGFVAWRLPLGNRWCEIGIRARNILNAEIRDYPGMVNPGGSLVGGELLTRKIFLFLRGVL
jgi:outer membrane receptor protein involved in Fe transport